MNKVNNLIKILILLIIGASIIVFFKNFSEYCNDILKIIIIIIYLIFIYSFYNNKHDLSFILYLVLLFAILFVRKKNNDNISNGNYISDWLSILFKNKTVFINVIGNIVLYIPLQIYLLFKTQSIKKSLFISLISIVILEMFQFLSKRGVFDLTDIIINFCGVLMASILYLIFEGVKHE